MLAMDVISSFIRSFSIPEQVMEGLLTQEMWGAFGNSGVHI
jgi:hypothetical protein